MKRFILILMVVLSCFSLTAAGTREETVELTVWHSNKGLLGEAFNSLVDTYNETVGKTEGVHVTPIFQGSASDTLTKFKSVTKSGITSDYPDIVQLDATGVIDIVTNDAICYADDLASAMGSDLSYLLDNCRTSITYKDKVIGFPFNSSTILYYYNRTLFDEKGIEPPRTLDDLIEIAPVLTENGRYAIANVPTTYEMLAFIGQQNGLSYMTDNENGHKGIPTEVIFDKEGTFENFLTRWKDLYATGGLSNQTKGVTTAFVSGQIASMFASTSNLTTILQSIGDRFELGVAPFVMVDENSTGGVNIGGGNLFAIDKGDEKNRAIWSFLRYATGEEAQLEWHKATGYFPVAKGTYEMEEYKSFIEENPLFKVASDQLMNSNPQVVGLWIPNGYQVYYSLQSNIKNMLENDGDVSTTVDTIATEINGYLDEFHRQNID